MANAHATQTIIVPLSNGPKCGHHNPRTNMPCRRVEGHTGRHAFIWQKLEPGLVREVWS